MSTRGATLHAPAEAVRADHPQPSSARLPLVVHVLALGTFLMGTTEFVVAGLLPEIAGDLQAGVAQTGLMITVFAIALTHGRVAQVAPHPPSRDRHAGGRQPVDSSTARDRSRMGTAAHVLLHSQPLTRITRLSTDDVQHADGRVLVRLGHRPSPVPALLDGAPTSLFPDAPTTRPLRVTFQDQRCSDRCARPQGLRIPNAACALTATGAWPSLASAGVPDWCSVYSGKCWAPWRYSLGGMP